MTKINPFIQNKISKIYDQLFADQIMPTNFSYDSTSLVRLDEWIKYFINTDCCFPLYEKPLNGLFVGWIPIINIGRRQVSLLDLWIIEGVKFQINYKNLNCCIPIVEPPFGYTSPFIKEYLDDTNSFIKHQIITCLGYYYYYYLDRVDTPIGIIEYETELFWEEYFERLVQHIYYNPDEYTFRSVASL